MISPFEKLEALAQGFKLHELIRYNHLRGIALVKDLRTGVEKVYSYSYAKFLEDRGLAEVLSVGLTIEEVTKGRGRKFESVSESKRHPKVIKAIERAESLLKILKSSSSTQVIKRSSNLDFVKIKNTQEEKPFTNL